MGQEFKINDCGEIIREGEAKTKKTNWWSIVSLLLFLLFAYYRIAFMNHMRELTIYIGNEMNYMRELTIYICNEIIQRIQYLK